MEVDFLGEIPLNINIRINSDEGVPNKTIYEDKNTSIHFDKISEKLIEFIAKDDTENIDGPIIKFE